MKTLFAICSAGLLGAAVLVSATVARAVEPCGNMTCRQERQCHIEVYPCGTNANGTVIFCYETVCEEKTVCEPVTPCVGSRPPIYRDFPDLPVLPDFPDLPDFPPILW